MLRLNKHLPFEQIRLAALTLVSFALTACSECPPETPATPIVFYIKMLAMWCAIPTAILLGFLGELIRSGLRGGWLAKTVTILFLMALGLYNTIAGLLIIVLPC